jgi:hypothetical protein
MSVQDSPNMAPRSVLLEAGSSFLFPRSRGMNKKMGAAILALLLGDDGLSASHENTLLLCRRRT